MLKTIAIGVALVSLVCRAGSAGTQGQGVAVGGRVELRENWLLKSSCQMKEEGDVISTGSFAASGWYPTCVPATVLTTLVKNGVYPNPRIGLDCYRIPDACEEFNQKYDLARYSYLPDRRNPWRDPYWYRTAFDLPAPRPGEHVWLNFNSINYRAEVWLNGARIADHQQMVGMFQRFRFDVTAQARGGRNVLAVKVWPVDHPGLPDKQLKVFGPHRGEHKEIERDVTEIETAGYDCMMTVPDRNMGICQEVFLDRTGPVDLRHPFVVTGLPLPDTSRATLSVSAELVNVTGSAVRGVLRGSVVGTDVRFQQAVELGPNQTKLVQVEPKPVLRNPRLWWPVNYGAQPQYDLVLQLLIPGSKEDQLGATGGLSARADRALADKQPVAPIPQTTRGSLETGGALSAGQTVRFSVRQIGSEMHTLDGWHGRRVLVNGQRIFCRGGYIQPELLLDWDARRIETEIRYFADANMNLIYFEDIPNPPDAFLDACDRQGVLFGNCFYACSWVTKPGRPQDAALLERCTVDVLKRYRNHPSLIMYMAMNEGYTCREVYQMWRRQVVALDETRFRIPSGYFPDFIKNEPIGNIKSMAHFTNDLPAGMNDLGTKSYGWQEPATYFRWVRDDRSWMFKMESGSASLPPISSLAKFLPDLGARSSDGAPFPLTETWAHHGANDYYKPYDAALRRLHGEPESVADYCWKGHLITADQHRAMYEAVNHRLWDITSGFTEWKINSCYPDVQWQNFDYYHKPVISHFFIKRACRPLHVQLNPPDHAVSVINCTLQPQADLEVTARLFDLASRPLGQRTARISVPANAYREAFAIQDLPELAPLVFVKLELRDAAGRAVADNFYWLRGRNTPDFKALQGLPPVKLDAALRIDGGGGDELLAHARITNPGNQIAFFVQAALTKGSGGEEILPVFWDDNYVSLLPGETRQLSARIARRDLGGKQPALEVGGWNVQGEYACLELSVKPKVKADERFTVTARIAQTFLDGGRVALLIDGRPSGAKWAWARGTKADLISFPVTLSQPGRHRLSVARQTINLEVE